MKNDVNAISGEAGIDTLLTSEWTKIEEMANLLAPFASQADTLQTNCLSLSFVLPYAIGGATPKFLGGPNLRPRTDVLQAIYGL